MDYVMRVDFDAVPLRTHIEAATARINQQEADFVAKRNALQPLLSGVHTRLTPLQKQFKAGEPILLRLELINGGPEELFYDDQRFRGCSSMIVKDEHGEVIPDTAPPVQTGGAEKPIAPGETRVLYGCGGFPVQYWDITSRYKIAKPGRYTVQFGGGLAICSPRTEKHPDLGCSAGFRSNIVELEVVATRPE